MARVVNSAAWLAGAVTAAAAWWYLVVYVRNDYNHGYGRDTWFQLQLYVSVLAGVGGLIGFSIAALVRSRPGAVWMALLAGVVFSLAELTLGFLLHRAFPDREVLVHQIIGAVVIGAASVLIAGGRST